MEFKKRQRCLAHLIRKGVALAGGLNPVGVTFGDWLLREMRGLIHEVAEGTGACKLHRDDDAEKVRALVRNEQASVETQNNVLPGNFPPATWMGPVRRW
jgi:hypothetical protein